MTQKQRNYGKINTIIESEDRGKGLKRWTNEETKRRRDRQKRKQRHEEVDRHTVKNAKR